VHLDLSAASQAVALARSEVRGLKTNSFVQASLLDAPKLGRAGVYPLPRTQPSAHRVSAHRIGEDFFAPVCRAGG
jgi:hypothetical protein